MAELDQHLEPGEQVLYRDPPPRLKSCLPTVLVMAVAMTVFIIGLSDENLVDDGCRKIALVGMFFIFILVVYEGAFLLFPGAMDPLCLRSAETLITPRRVLWWHAGNTPPLRGIELSDIREVAPAASDHVTVETRDGSRTRFHHLRKPRRFAEALARAANRPTLRTAGHLARLYELGLATVGPLCFLLVLWLYREPLLGLGDSWAGAADWALRLLCLLGLFVVSLLVGAHLTWTLGLVALRPWVTAEQAETWLCRDRESGWITNLVTWQNPINLALARLLYGLPSGPNGAEENAHGR